MPSAGFITRSLILTCVGLITLPGCQHSASRFDKWHAEQPVVRDSEDMESRIAALVEQLSLEQKVAQLIQADIGSVTPAEVRQYRIGSVLNGGGQTPRDNRQATAEQWVELAEELYDASMSPAEGVIPIPLIWGVDAVHGHGNVRGATLYPHNIALGATRNTELVKQISAATAIEIAATGLDWNFAPTVAVALDDRWGRTYESFSEDTDLVSEMGAAAVEGLQGLAGSDDFLNERRVVATAKHFIGDGGTQHGDDQGWVEGDENALLEVHLPSYISALEAGAQTVMASYSWWNGVHSHENAHLMKDLLKGRLGFDGVVVSDWQAIGYVPGCTIDNCPTAINAGVDLFMIPNAPDWKQFYHNTLAQVRSGQIPMARIDDAVSRILRVKMRADLWEKPSPAQRELAGNQSLIGSPAHRQLARQAVRESLVLLKNNGVLPIAGDAKVVISGPGADNLAMQSGGWSVTWQGTDTTNEDYPGATSIQRGLEQALNELGGELLTDKDIDGGEKPDVAIVVFGETPYAEMYGDIENLQTLEVDQLTKTGLKHIQNYKQRGIPVVALLLSGRPLWVNKELNAADAFVAAWLPGTEGDGIADVIVGDTSRNPRHDFKGTLSFSWPASPCDASTHKDSKPAPLFQFGYGLNYQTGSSAWQALDETTKAWQFGCLLGDSPPAETSQDFNAAQGWQYFAEKKTLEKQPIDSALTLGAVTAAPLEGQKNGVEAAWDGSALGRITLRNGELRNDFLPMLAHQGILSFDLFVDEFPTADISLVTYSGLSAANYLDIKSVIEETPLKQWRTVHIDLACFDHDRLDFRKVGVPFGIQTDGELKLRVANVKYESSHSKRIDLQCN